MPSPGAASPAGPSPSGSPSPAPPDDGPRIWVRGLALTLGLLLAESRRRQALEEEVQHLQRALISRAVIDQAKGIVMADRRCSADEAFEHLVHLSSSRHVKLRDVARAIVEQAAEDSPDLR